MSNYLDGTLAAILDSGDAAMHLLRPEGTITRWNRAAERLYGWTAAEANGAHVSLIVPPERHGELADFIERLRRGEIIQADTVRMHKGGVPVAVTATFSPIMDRDGLLVGISVMTRTPDARQRADAVLEENLYLHEQAQSLAKVGTWVSDLDAAGASVWSRESYRIVGVDEGTPTTVGTFLAAVHPDDRPLLDRARRDAIESGKPYEAELRLLRPEGEIRWIHVKGTVVRDAQGKALRLVGATQDITARRRGLDELRASEQRCRQMLDMSTVGVWRIDADGTTTFMNARMVGMLGYEPHELIGRHCIEVVTPESLEGAVATLARRRDGISEQFDVELYRKDGTRIYAMLEAVPLFDREGAYEGSLAMVVDVTARKRAEEDLRLSEARSRLLLDSTGEGLYGLDLDGRCVFANAACVRMLGYRSEDDLLGKDMHALVHHSRRHGERYPASECRVHIGATSKAGLHVDDEVLWRADGTSFDAEYRSFPMCVDGVRIGAVVSFVDITDRRRAEAALRQTQKMEAIGRLAGGVAHDFNNLLCVILTYSTLILDSLSAGDPMRADVEEVRGAGERAAELTKQLLAFSRRQVLEPTALDVEQVLTSVEKMLRRLLGEDIALSFTVSGAPRVHADRGQLDQILMNLAVNARDAMPDGGTLDITASVVELDAAGAACRDGIGPGEYVLLSVTDTGTGMAPEVCSRAFEPFFTTKDPHKGTGLGLSTVFGVVKQSGGAISVASEVGRGTRFEILLPHTREQARSVPSSRSAPEGARGTETVLLVEDEEQVRTLVRGVLRGHGYEVIDVSNAGEALLVCEQHQGTIDLLLTDVVLPRMSGRALAERVAPSRPEMRVLYVSGYTDDEVLHRGVQAERVAFLHKPFTPSSILRKVRQVLDDVPPAAIAC